MSDAICINNLTGGYATQNTLFNNFSLTIPSGQFISLVGPNGAGKTTLLKFMIKELPVKNSTIFISDSDISRLKQRDLAHKLAFVPQHKSLSYAFTVSESVALGRYSRMGRFQSLTGNDRKSIQEAMEITGVMQFSHALVTELSGGEAQRVSLARALCQEAPILILDEPVNHLDLRHQRDIMHLLRYLADTKNMTIVCVLHALDLVQTFSDLVVLIDQGEIMAQGTPEEVLTAEQIKAIYDMETIQVLTERGTVLIPEWSVPGTSLLDYVEPKLCSHNSTDRSIR